MPSIITIQSLSVAFGRFMALDDISLSLDAGTITGCIGPSGAGKTTLIRSLVGRQKLSSGSILIWGTPAGASQLRRRISYMTQESSIYSDLTVSENLTYFTRMLGYRGKRVRQTVKKAIEEVSLQGHEGQLVARLSGGQKQRVSLAVALLGDPELLILDEPTVGLDPVLREQLWQLFRRLQAHGKTIIVSSHVMDEAERCDNLLLIRDGRVIASGSPVRLCEKTHSATVEESFLKLAGGEA